MPRIFNLTKIESLREILSTTINFYFDSIEVVNKTIFKKIKDLKRIEYAKILFYYMMAHEPQNLVPLAKKFFPLKFEEMERRQSNIKVNSFYYSPSDDKFHCLVLDNGNERSLMVRTDLYEKRTKEYTDRMIDSLKKEFDKFYGFFLEKCKSSDKCYITDYNIDKKSPEDYRVLAYYDKLGRIHNPVAANPFGRIKNTCYVCP
jgi:hypothetical protein